MNAPRDHRVQAWFHSLREAVASRNEPLYRERVVQFLITPEGASFVQRNLDTAAARAVMAAVYERLAPALELRAPTELLDRLLGLGDAPASDEIEGSPGHGDAATMALAFLRYLRLGKEWSRACGLDATYGVALALLFFEPLLLLFDEANHASLAPSAARPAERAAPSSNAPVQCGARFA
jgi:hypothetical protein